MRGLKLLAALARQTPDISIWSWATVTDDSPLRVQLDGESAALDITPDSLVSGLSVSDRVWVQLVTNANPARRYRRLIILGTPLPADVAALDTRVDALEAPLFGEDVDTSGGTTTSTSYTSTLTGGTAAGIAFVAPLSGKVLIHNACSIDNDTAAINTWCSFHVRTGDSIGAGSDVLAAADSFAIQHPGTSVTHLGRAKAVTGLTPGADYNVIQVFRVSSASTGAFGSKNLIVEGK